MASSPITCFDAFISPDAETSGYTQHLISATQYSCSTSLQMPDWHPGVWQTNQELQNLGLWVKNWVGLVNDLIGMPNTTGKLILDLLNVSLGMHDFVCNRISATSSPHEPDSYTVIQVIPSQTQLNCIGAEMFSLIPFLP